MLRFFFGLKNFFVGQFFSAHVNRSLNWESLKSLRFLPEITVILDKHWFLEETHMFLQLVSLCTQDAFNTTPFVNILIRSDFSVIPR